MKLKITGGRLAEEHVAAGFLFQECKVGDLPNDDDTESLPMVVQGQNYPLHGEVSLHKRATYFRRGCRLATFANIADFRLTLKLSCAMNFLIYPHDTQECKLQMESRKSQLHNRKLYSELYRKHLTRKQNNSVNSVAHDGRNDLPVGSRCSSRCRREHRAAPVAAGEKLHGRLHASLLHG